MERGFSRKDPGTSFSATQERVAEEVRKQMELDAQLAAIKKAHAEELEALRVRVVELFLRDFGARKGVCVSFSGGVFGIHVVSMRAAPSSASAGTRVALRCREQKRRGDCMPLLMTPLRPDLWLVRVGANS